MAVNEQRSKNNGLFGEILRFLLAGGIATACDYAVYLLFRMLIIPASLLPGNPTWDVCSAEISTALGFLTGLIINWILSVVFVFKGGRRSVGLTSKSDFIKFTVIAIIDFVFTELVVGLGVLLIHPFPLFGTEVFLSLGWNEWLMKVIATCIVLVFNYFARKKWIFHT
jgi:putative flippase GtrA